MLEDKIIISNVNKEMRNLILIGLVVLENFKKRKERDEK